MDYIDKMFVQISELKAENERLTKGCAAWMEDCKSYQKKCDVLWSENKSLSIRLQYIQYRLGGVRFDLDNTTKSWNETIAERDNLIHLCEDVLKRFDAHIDSNDMCASDDQSCSSPSLDDAIDAIRAHVSPTTNQKG